MNRCWLSYPNQNLCFSLYLESIATLMDIPSLPMAAALAITDFLRSYAIPASPKWPNDILVGDKKICGILSERLDGRDGKQKIVLGIGLNINLTKEDADQIDRPATSMQIESGKYLQPDQTLEQLLPHLSYWIHKWEDDGFFRAISKEWSTHSGPLGRPLTVHDGEIRKTGTLVGYGPHGELLLNTAEGIETIWSGDLYPN